MQIVITTKDKSIKKDYRRLRIPWLPEEIQLSSGGTRVQTYEIINLGEAEVQSGTNLETVSWTSTFPGAGHKDLPFLKYTAKDVYRKPDTIIKMLGTWKKKGTPLTIKVYDTQNGEVTATHISKNVILSDFDATLVGFYGDIEYSVTFKERRELKMSTSKLTKKKKSKKKKKKKIPKTYKVKKGDTLYKISVKFWGNGSMKKKLYKWNKKKIEKAAKKHGHKSSKNGKRLYKGTVIRLRKKK